MAEPLLIYCAYADCGVAQPLTSLKLKFCPSCGLVAKWTTDPHGRYFDDADAKWDLNDLDRKLLNSFRISTD